MDYEKKYKEALVNMQELYNSMKYMSSTDALHTTTALERAFPELVESKNKKIRNVITLIIKGIRANVFEEQGITKEDAITYLEKQGEQKVSIVDFKAEDWYVSKVDGKIHYMKYNPNKGIVWSEEDEENLNQLHKLIVKKAYAEYEIDTEDETLWGKHAILDNWLKSLKDRFQSHWKPNKEQMTYLEAAIEESNGNCILQSLYNDLKKLIENSYETN